LKKMGLLALALVLALGALGTAYAAWTDSVYIKGTAVLGTLDINPIAASSTFVYKDPVTKDIIIDYPASVDNPPAGYDTVAGAEATFNSTDDADSATMTFWGLYPLQEFKADLSLVYCGTVPAKVSVANISDPAHPETTDPLLAELWNLWKYGDLDKGYPAETYGIWIDGYHISNDDPPQETYHENLLGVQIHQSEQLDITMHVLLPEDTDYKNKVGLNFTGIISVVQWNEYEEP
jgi:hypothetical protein